VPTLTDMSKPLQVRVAREDFRTDPDDGLCPYHSLCEKRAGHHGRCANGNLSWLTNKARPELYWGADFADAWMERHKPYLRKKKRK